ncbi:hypothetical protein AKO1_011423 [Acrasis kona]|uniref:SET domain-containing protein n=1 Tax=Acrasis kona TaxID=1008807 RepID=A0AAW2ZJR0_9EUKA
MTSSIVQIEPNDVKQQDEHLRNEIIQQDNQSMIQNESTPKKVKVDETVDGSPNPNNIKKRKSSNSRKEPTPKKSKGDNTNQIKRHDVQNETTALDASQSESNKITTDQPTVNKRSRASSPSNNQENVEYTTSCPKHEMSTVYRIFDVCTDDCKIFQKHAKFPSKSNEQLVSLYTQIGNAAARTAARKQVQEIFLNGCDIEQCYLTACDFIKELTIEQIKSTQRRTRTSITNQPSSPSPSPSPNSTTKQDVGHRSKRSLTKKVYYSPDSPPPQQQQPSPTLNPPSPNASMNPFVIDDVRSRELTETRATVIHKINIDYVIPVDIVFLGDVIGRGIFAKCDIPRGSFLFEYKGDLIDRKEAIIREERYESQNKGCYMMYFLHRKQMCIDATDERYGVARLVNHRKEPNNNVFARKIIVNGVPRLCMFSCCAIRMGQELRHDYGDRSKKTIDMNPWLEE